MIPQIIYVTGADGTGKTMVAEALVRELRGRGVRAERYWSRFTNIFSKPLLAVCRLSGLSYYEEKGGVRIGYHDFAGFPMVSALFVLLQSMDVALVTLFRIWPMVIAGRVLVCDRGAYDTLVDVMVDTGIESLPGRAIGKAFTAFLPVRHSVVMLMRETDSVFRDRSDVAQDRKYGIKRDMYRICAERMSWKVVLNEGTPGQAVGKVMTALGIS